MSEDNSLQLVGSRKRKKVNLEKCIICQQENRSEKLTSTENGRSKIQAASSILQDDLLSDVDGKDIVLIKYHMKACYKRYILQSERAPSVQEDDAINDYDDQSKEELKTPGRNKRLKAEGDKKSCVICSLLKFKGDENLYGLCEEKRAKMFLCAIKLNLDDVYTKCSTYKTVEHILAADIVSHKNCMKRYLLQYQRNAEEIINYDDDDEYAGTDSDLQEAFKKMISHLNIETNRYAISTCRDILNENLEGYAVSNRKVKQMLIAHFGEDICFTYPKEKRKSQLFFSTKIASADLVETLRLNDPVKICAEKLKKECEEFDFLPENSYCDANDVEYSMNLYKQNRPKSWELFFNTLSDYRKKSVHIQRKCM